MNVARILRSSALLVTLVDVAGCRPTASRPVMIARPTPVVPAPKPPAAEPWPAITLPPPQDPAPVVADCRAGDVRACARAAQLYYDGWGIARDVGRVEMYAAIACKAQIAEACTLSALVHLADEHGDAPPGIQALKSYLESGVSGPETRPGLCIKLPSRDRWGWAAYQKSDCYSSHASASNEPSPVPEGEEIQKTYAACFDEGDTEACRGIAMTTNPDNELYQRFARICRTKGAACDVALGDTPQETARFRLQACLERSYHACVSLTYLAKDAGAPLDQLSVDRLEAQLCLHPEINFRPRSVGQGSADDPGPEYGCEPGAFKALAASVDPGDKVLLRELAHTPEEGGTP